MALNVVLYVHDHGNANDRVHENVNASPSMYSDDTTNNQNTRSKNHWVVPSIAKSCLLSLFVVHISHNISLHFDFHILLEYPPPRAPSAVLH